MHKVTIGFTLLSVAIPIVIVHSQAFPLYLVHIAPQNGDSFILKLIKSYGRLFSIQCPVTNTNLFKRKANFQYFIGFFRPDSFHIIAPDLAGYYLSDFPIGL